MLEDPKIQRLKELSKVLFPSDQQLEELARLKEELQLTDSDIHEEIQVIEPIREHRRIKAHNQAMEEELRRVQAERKSLELKLSLRKEKERIERAKNLLDGKIYCDDCKKWMWPSHFD